MKLGTLAGVSTATFWQAACDALSKQTAIYAASPGLINTHVTTIKFTSNSREFDLGIRRTF